MNRWFILLVGRIKNILGLPNLPALNGFCSLLNSVLKTFNRKELEYNECEIKRRDRG